MKTNQGEFRPFLFETSESKSRRIPAILLAFPVLFLHRIALFTVAEIPCNRTCGSTTVKYPFGFSGACPYILDSDCSESGDVHLNGFKVLNFTNSSIIVRPWQTKHNKSSCYGDTGIPSFFKQQFGLTSRNVLLLDNCTKSECKFNITRYYDGRKNCSAKSGLITCVSNTDGPWLSWNYLEASACKHFISSFISETAAIDTGSIRFDLDKLELGWWVNGACRPNSCSPHANCSNFRNPNNTEWGHICNCKEGFEGDGFSKGVGCKNVSGCKASGNLFRNCGKHSKVVLVICLVVAGIAMVVGIVLFYWCYQKSHCAFKTRRSTKRLSSAPDGPLSIPVYTYREMERATNGFSEKKRLGTGGFGTVYAGKLPGKSVVAVKKIRHRDTQGMEQVLNEIRLLSFVDHPNLVRLLGCCLDKGEPILVYEFMPNGTLSQHLQKERGEGLSWRTRVTVAADTAHALAYLHSALNPPICHRDVKSSNILLDSDFNAKVADFGLSRLFLAEASHISTAPQGTPGYLDPQYHENFHLTDKSDVYSFGVVLVEIITALKVVDFSRKESEINLAFLAVEKIGRGCVDEIIDPFLEVDKDLKVKEAIHRVAELAFRCLASDRNARPTMVEVVQELELLAYDKSSLKFADRKSTNINFQSNDSSSHSIQKNSGVVVQYSWSSSLQSSR